MIDTQELIIPAEPGEEKGHQYPLTLKHVRQFLATKAEEDSLGYRFRAYHCLLSQTLDFLYPEQKFWRVDIGTYAPADRSTAPYGGYSLSPDLDALRRAFDYTGVSKVEAVTKSKLREYIEYLAHLEEGATWESRLVPFIVSDVFGE